MFELYDLYNSIREKPLTWGSIIAILLFIVDKVFKQLFIRYIRKFLHIRDREGVLMHMERLNTIESKLDLLLKERGLEPSSQKVVPSSANESTVSAWRSGGFSWLSHRMLSAVSSAANTIKYSGVDKKMKLNKAILIPILTTIAGFIKESMGYEIGSEYIDLAANVIIMLIIPLIGYFMHPRKEALSEAEKRYLEQ